MKQLLRTLLLAVVIVAVAAGGFLAGRHTAPVRDRWAEGEMAGYDYGVGVGRSLQAAEVAPAADRPVAESSFQSGYAAGQQDSFGSYDGGWGVGVPYVIVLAPGLGGAPYRIVSRDEMAPGVRYWPCANPALVCHGP